jgi:hypothetical protein
MAGKQNAKLLSAILHFGIFWSAGKLFLRNLQFWCNRFKKVSSYNQSDQTKFDYNGRSTA